MYFANVGGTQLEAAIGVANDHARFALCGMIGQYNDETRPPGPSNEQLEAAPAAFLGLFSGENVGKMLVKLGEAPSNEGPSS